MLFHPFCGVEICVYGVHIHTVSMPYEMCVAHAYERMHTFKLFFSSMNILVHTTYQVLINVYCTRIIYT